MARRTVNETIKRDNFLVDLLLQHKGKENALPSKVISEILAKHDFRLNAMCIHQTINKIMLERRLPICSLNGKGYFWAKSKEDITECIKHLQSRVDSITEHIDHLKNFIIE